MDITTPIYSNDKAIHRRYFFHVALMLSRRIDNDGSTIFDYDNDKLATDFEQQYSADDKLFSFETRIGTFRVRIIDEQIQSATKPVQVASFLAKYPNDNKIILAPSLSPKALPKLRNKSEVFRFIHMMLDITRYQTQPKFVLLSAKESSNIKKNFVPNNCFSLLNKYDTMVRYYNIPVGRLVVILRSSTTAGETLDIKEIN